jgi:hypothetical protein
MHSLVVTKRYIILYYVVDLFRALSIMNTIHHSREESCSMVSLNRIEDHLHI